MARAMILCAGFGTRLRPLTEELPKPLLPIGDRPLLGHITRELYRAGYREAVVNTHWLSDKFSHINHDLGLTLEVIHEPVIRGVAGGVAGARARLEAPVVVWNGDILLEAPPFEAALARAAATSDCCLAILPREGAAGVVGLGADDRVVRLRGEVHGREVRSGDYVGFFALGARALAELPDQGCLIGDYCLPRLRRGAPVYACDAPGPFWDIGSVPSYLATNQHWLAANANREAGSFVHPSATVDRGVQLARSVVGAGARVTGSGAVEGCVLWPGASVSAPLRNAVVTPHRCVRLDEPAPR